MCRRSPRRTRRGRRPIRLTIPERIQQIALAPNEPPSDTTVAQVARYAVGYIAGTNRTSPRNLETIPKTAISAAITDCIANADELEPDAYNRFVDEVHGEVLAIIGADVSSDTHTA